MSQCPIAGDATAAHCDSLSRVCNVYVLLGHSSVARVRVCNEQLKLVRIYEIIDRKAVCYSLSLQRCVLADNSRPTRRDRD